MSGQARSSLPLLSRSQKSGLPPSPRVSRTTRWFMARWVARSPCCWVYLSANILLFGAEISAEVAQLQGEDTEGRPPDEPRDRRSSALAVMRGLVLAPGQRQISNRRTR